MKAALIGLPGSGRETIFRALTGQGASPAGDLRQGEALVRDERLDFLSSLFQPKKHTPARLELFLPKPPAKTPAEAFKTALEKAREADVLLLVIRNFPGSEEEPDPRKEAGVLAEELLLTDYLSVEKRLERLAEEKKRGKKNDPEELSLLTGAHELLEKNQPLRLRSELAAHPKMRGFGFLSAKPLLTLINCPDDWTEEEDPALGGQLFFRGLLEEEFSRLSAGEAAELMSDYGLKELGADRVVRTLYRLMDLISFFTVGEDECRSWTVRRGQDALRAAGEIHSDIQKGFIRAEVVAFEDFRQSGSFPEAKKRGLFRLEGKTYPVQDGDIIHFRFNV
jgi:ribosome-binding ATPase YchF (GTP1/OBG family)